MTIEEQLRADLQESIERSNRRGEIIRLVNYAINTGDDETTIDAAKRVAKERDDLLAALKAVLPHAMDMLKDEIKDDDLSSYPWIEQAEKAIEQAEGTP